MKKILIILLSMTCCFCQAQTTSKADKLFNEAENFMKINEFDKALDYYLQADKAFIAENRGETAEYAQCLHNIGRVYSNLDNNMKSRDYTKQALDLRKKLFGEVNEQYITSLNNYALSYFIDKQYNTAIEYQLRVLSLCDELPSPHQNIGLFTLNMGRSYYFADDMKNAAKYWESALNKVEKFGEMYEYLLQSLSAVYDKTGDMDNLYRIMALGEEHNQHELQKNCNEPKCALERAEYYSVKGDNASAKEWFVKVLSMDLDDVTRIAAQKKYATYLGLNLNDYSSAVDYYISAANISLKLYGNNENYAELIYYAALYSYFNKNYLKSIEYYDIAIDCYSQSKISAAKDMIAQCYHDKGNSYSGMENYEKAIECFWYLVNYYETNDTESDDYPKAILSLAKAEKFNKNYEISIKHHKEAMKIFKDRNMEKEYADASTSLKLCYYYSGMKEEDDYDDDSFHKLQNDKLDTIIKQELSNLELTKKYLGKITYANSLGTIAGCYALKGSYAESVDFYEKFINAVREAVQNEFRLQNMTERMIVWEEEKVHINSLLDIVATLPVGNETLMDRLAAVVYDAALLSKGILLKSSVEFEKILAAYNDKSLIDKYNRIKDNETAINNLRNKVPSDENHENILLLSQQNQNLQLELYKGCAEYADFTDYISYNWKDVQAKLAPTDVAIEFVSISTDVLDENNYMIAVILDRDMETPVILPVCNLNIAKFMVNYKDLFDTPDAGNIVWITMQKYLSGKTRIFFSADGVFNHTAIEYLQYEGNPLSEQFEVYRLSTTKELCFRHVSPQISNVALFGNIDYNDVDSANHSIAMDIGSSEKRGSGDVSTLGNLENTLKEVTDIESVMKAKNVTAAVFTGTSASKDAFIGLSGSDINILHVATHGIFVNEDDASDDKSMKNSKLAFAGANLDDDFDGGNCFVNAEEIAEMSLRRCDLVVLSACETGLGKLGDDGVFGLQRGFKNAGVHSLLMSMENVNDASTAELMIAFYKHYMNGSTKREALIKAQKELKDSKLYNLRNINSFILLDAYDK